MLMRKNVKGVVAIEFALIFSVLFALFYAIISYVLPLFMMQAFQDAAADGVRAAVSIVKDCEEEVCDESYKTRVENAARQAVQDRIEKSPLSSIITDRIEFPAPSYDENTGILAAEIRYPNYAGNPPLPVIWLPLVGNIPPLPETLSSSASVRL